MSKKPTIQDSDGETRHEYSESCPKCMSQKVTKTVVQTADFDEHGWFYPANFQCQSPKCAHKWVEKFRVQQ